MKLFHPISFLILLPLSTVALAQQNGAPLPLPAPTPASVTTPQNAAVTKKEAGNVNAELLAARAATAKENYAEAESLMIGVTRANPAMILPWVELGLAELGLEKYSEAEHDFKVALGIDPVAVAQAHNGDFYQAPDAPGVVAPGATRASRNSVGGTVTSGNKRTPDILGTSYASLGEIYIREKKLPEAKQAYDAAVDSNPQGAASYRHNEAVYFFKAGDSDDQLAAADQAIALDPSRAENYYFKAQALVSKATLDPKTQKMILPPGCAEAYQKYLSLAPKGPYSADAIGVLTAAGGGTLQHR